MTAAAKPILYYSDLPLSIFSRRERDTESATANEGTQSEMAEEQTMDTVERTDSNENENKNSPSSEEQGSATTSSSQIMRMIRSEFESPVEMENPRTLSLIASNDGSSDESDQTSTDDDAPIMDELRRIPTMESLEDEVKVELEPFDFLSLPDRVRQQILRAALVSHKQISPYWNLGALEVAAHHSNVGNYTEMVAAFAGNRELVDQATTILYSENHFHLKSAELSLWWLKRIGSNISKIRNLAIVLDGKYFRISYSRS